MDDNTSLDWSEILNLIGEVVSADTDSLFSRAFRESQSTYILGRDSCENNVNGGFDLLTAALQGERAGLVRFLRELGCGWVSYA